MIASDSALAQWLDIVLSEDGPPDLRSRLLLASYAIYQRAVRRAPSMAHLSRMTALPARTVAHLIRSAARAGWISAEELRRVQVTDDAVRLITNDDVVRLQ